MKRRDFFRKTATGVAAAGTVPLMASSVEQTDGLGDRSSDKWLRLDTGKMDTPVRKRSVAYDVVVIGGGMTGVCAAVAAVRMGAKVVLVQDRPVLGGNASSEIRVTVNSGGRQLGRETGIIEEILIENLHHNPQESYPVWDHVVYNYVVKHDNLELMLNTQAVDVIMEKSKIRSAICWQSTSETEITVSADIFIDCSGDGLVAAKAGAEYRTGREASSEFDESAAPEKADGWVMGDTIMMITRNMGKPVPFHPPPYFIKFDGEKATKEMHRQISNLKEGFWWVELGSKVDVIGEREEIRHRLMRHFYGVWDYIKNSGKFPQAENLALDWIGSIPGRRESRRFIGDYMLSQKDMDEFRHYKDAVGYGGWSYDEHAPGGIENMDVPASFFHKRAEKRLYEIPFRCLYSKNIDNLMFAGRNISVTHIALSSTRIIGTCSTLGQAVGTASVMCVRKKLSPREVAEKHMDELQEQLLRDDSYIPNRPARDKNDLARKAGLIFASTTTSGDARLLTDGHIRDEKETIHHWESAGLNAEVQLEWEKSVEISTVEVKGDTNIYRGINMHKDPEKGPKRGQILAVPPELVKSMRVEARINGQWEKVGAVRNNLVRRIRFNFKTVRVTAIRLKLDETWGAGNVKLFEVRCYA